MTVAGLVVLPAAAEARITFIGIEQGRETREADDELRRYLEQRSIAAGGDRYEFKTFEYETAIRKLAEWSSDGDNHYVARVTPYVYVAAEMLGAQFELVGTYESRATASTTYHSYLVVRRADLEASGGRPLGPDDVLQLLRRQTTPARFIYHSRFSTSSYLLPSLFFRKNRVFDMEESTGGGLTAIDSKQQGDGSTDLVLSVAAGDPERLLFAAVWDGTKSKFEEGGAYDELGHDLHFIQLSTELPNDVLVCSASLPDKQKEALRGALGESAVQWNGDAKPTLSGDFKGWLDIYSSPRAMEAMAGLRFLAREAPAPVTVEIAEATGPAGADLGWIREAAAHAVRLSGTEFVVLDPDYHGQSDFLWSLRAVRRGHVVLTSRVADAKVEPQVLAISYRPGEKQQEELTQRIGALIHERLHRVRYLWPFEDRQPLVVRDLPFRLESGTKVEAQPIIWNDHLRHQYTPGDSLSVHIGESDAYKFRIAEDDAPRLDRREAFDPMSNVSYRVVLQRPDEPESWFWVFTTLFWSLTLGSLVGAGVALRRPKAAAA